MRTIPEWFSVIEQHLLGGGWSGGWPGRWPGVRRGFSAVHLFSPDDTTTPVKPGSPIDVRHGAIWWQCHWMTWPSSDGWSWLFPHPSWLSHHLLKCLVSLIGILHVAADPVSVASPVPRRVLQIHLWFQFCYGCITWVLDKHQSHLTTKEDMISFFPHASHHIKTIFWTLISGILRIFSEILFCLGPIVDLRTSLPVDLFYLPGYGMSWYQTQGVVLTSRHYACLQNNDKFLVSLTAWVASKYASKCRVSTINMTTDWFSHASLGSLFQYQVWIFTHIPVLRDTYIQGLQIEQNIVVSCN